MADNSTFDPTKTRIALPVTAAPILDGVVNDSEWDRAEGAGDWWRMEVDANPSDGWRGGDITAGSVPANDADLSAILRVSFDDSNLYVGVRVTDANVVTDSASANSANEMTGLDDSVEIFIDGDNSNFPTLDSSGANPAIVATGGQFAITANNAYREAEAGNPGFGANEAWHAVTATSGSGYHAEFRISLATIGNPQPGDVIGFNIAINDDDGGGAAERTVIWTGEAHVEASYGNLLIGTKSHEAPKLEVAPLVDGDVSSAEYGNGTEIVVTPSNGMYDLASGDDDFDDDDHRFSAWVAHDDEAVYVAVVVTDDSIQTDSAAAGSADGTTWQDDSVEVFFDADESNFGGNPLGQAGQLFDGQYVMTANGARRDAEASNPQFGLNSDWFGAAQSTPDGFAIEFRIKKSALPLPAEGVPLGFNLVINDDDGVTGGNREGQLMWSGRAHAEFSYGSLILSDVLVGDLGLRFNDIEYALGGDQITLEWASRNGRHYIIDRSTDLVEWMELNDSYDSQGESTTFVDSDLPAAAPQLFYRVTEN